MASRPFPQSDVVPDDDCAKRALAWLNDPDRVVVYCDDCPKQTPEELALFRPVRLVKSRRKSRD